MFLNVSEFFLFHFFFFLDLWMLLHFILFRLSGESPFQGNDDAETLALVTAAQWEFDEESFEEISEEAKNFISSLLDKDPRWFITTCHDHLCLLSHFSLTKLRSPGRGCPARRPSLTPGWLHLNRESWRARLCPRRRWRDTLPGRSGRWRRSKVSLSCCLEVCLEPDLWPFSLASQKAGKALLALKRMTLLSKGDNSSTTPTSPGQGSTIALFCCYPQVQPWCHTVPEFYNLFTQCLAESPLSPEAMHALQSLEHKMQEPPQFTQSLQDQTVAQGSSARLTCHLRGK